MRGEGAFHRQGGSGELDLGFSGRSWLHGFAALSRV